MFIGVTTKFINFDGVVSSLPPSTAPIKSVETFVRKLNYKIVVFLFNSFLPNKYFINRTWKKAGAIRPTNYILERHHTTTGEWVKEEKKTFKILEKISRRFMRNCIVFQHPGYRCDCGKR